MPSRLLLEALLLSGRQTSGLDPGTLPARWASHWEGSAAASPAVTRSALSRLSGAPGRSTLAEGVPCLRGEETVAHRPAEEPCSVQSLPEGSETDRLRGPGGRVPHDQQRPHR